MSDVLAARLLNQCLRSTPHETPQAVTAWMGAVQAQDYLGAAWALSLRARALTLADVDAALAEGTIVRTHVLRPTWHFVAPADLRWMVQLSGERIKAQLRSYDRLLELDDRVYARGRRLLERALEGGRQRTRTELAAALHAGGIAASGQRLAHIVMHAELDAAICSGARRGTQFTYALVAERVPATRPIARDEALGMLAVRYFRSHGPATVRDFSWWSGLTMGDARRAIAVAGVHDAVLASPPRLDRARGAHFLLPNYDEYLNSYRDRGAFLDHEACAPARIGPAEYPHQIVIDGRVAGGWRRRVSTNRVSIVLRWYGAVRGKAALQAQARRFGRFLGLPSGLD